MAFKLISIAVFIAFYGCYFAKMFYQKKQGIQTDQIGKGKVGFEKFVEVTMKFAAVLVFAAGLVSILVGVSGMHCGDNRVYNRGVDHARQLAGRRVQNG